MTLNVQEFDSINIAIKIAHYDCEKNNSASEKKTPTTHLINQEIIGTIMYINFFHLKWFLMGRYQKLSWSLQSNTTMFHISNEFLLLALKKWQDDWWFYGILKN